MFGNIINYFSLNSFSRKQSLNLHKIQKPKCRSSKEDMAIFSNPHKPRIVHIILIIHHSNHCWIFTGHFHLFQYCTWASMSTNLSSKLWLSCQSFCFTFISLLSACAIKLEDDDKYGFNAFVLKGSLNWQFFHISLFPFFFCGFVGALFEIVVDFINVEDDKLLICWEN